MIKAIIFDFFDVLVSDGERAFYEKHVPEGSEMALQCRAIEDAFMAGKINYEIYQQKIADVTGVPREEVGAWLADNHVNVALFEYIRNRLKPSYKLAIISNAGGDWVDEMLGAQNALLFDEIVLSFEVNYMKPAQEIYHIALDRLGIQPDEAIFIDDKQKYVDAAKEIGMNGITFSTTNHFIKDIERVLNSYEN